MQFTSTLCIHLLVDLLLGVALGLPGSTCAGKQKVSAANCISLPQTTLPTQSQADTSAASMNSHTLIYKITTKRVETCTARKHKTFQIKSHMKPSNHTFCLLLVIACDLGYILLQATSKTVTSSLSVSLGLHNNSTIVNKHSTNAAVA